jgi:hypothetical protein
MSRLIVKVQRWNGSGDWLVHDKTRHIDYVIAKVDLPTDVQAALGKDGEGYFEAEQIPARRVSIKKRVADQNW